MAGHDRHCDQDRREVHARGDEHGTPSRDGPRLLDAAPERDAHRERSREQADGGQPEAMKEGAVRDECSPGRGVLRDCERHGAESRPEERSPGGRHDAAQEEGGEEDAHDVGVDGEGERGACSRSRQCGAAHGL